MRIAVDAMGGDFAPAEIVRGALLARDQYGVEILLVGRPDAIHPHLPEPLPSGISIVAAEDEIGMSEEPAVAIRRKRKASIRITMDMVRNDRADAAVAAGNTGAAMAAALLRLGRIPGIDRPAIAALMPTLKQKPVMLLDVGANVDSKPKYLEHFAIMGSIYSQYVLGVKTPRVGLLNIGEESSKGNEQVITAYQHLSSVSHINFAGNAEGRDVLTGDFDVVVCDGFVGNILLKFAESVGMVATQILREELPRGWHGKLGATILRPNLKSVKQRMDYAEYGGGLLLGVNGVCIITHGSSKAPMVSNAIRLAKEAAEARVIERVQTEVLAAQADIDRSEADQLSALKAVASGNNR